MGKLGNLIVGTIKTTFIIIFVGSLASIFIYTHLIMRKLDQINDFYERRHMQRDEYMVSVAEKCKKVSDKYLIYAVDARAYDQAETVEDLIDEYLPANINKLVFEENETPIIVGSAFPNEGAEEDWVCVAVTYPFGKYPVINIQKDMIKDSLFHEIGHATEFIQTPGVNVSKSVDFVTIYKEEKDDYKLNEYCLASSSEFFAECFETFILNPDILYDSCPKTYEFIDNFIKSIE